MTMMAMKARKRKTKAANPPPGLKSLGIPANREDEIVRLVQKGFPFSWLARFQKRSGLPWEKLADWVSIPKRTLSRRQCEGRLTSEESDRVLRAAKIFDLTVDLFEGDIDGAGRWLLAPQWGLGEETPVNFSKSNPGAQEVEDLIGRLEWGDMA